MLPSRCAVMAARRVLLLGAGDLTDETAAALEAAGADVRAARGPRGRRAARRRSSRGADAVAVVSRDDAWPLRAALLVRHLDARRPDRRHDLRPGRGPRARAGDRQLHDHVARRHRRAVARRPVPRRRPGGAARRRPPARAALRGREVEQVTLPEVRARRRARARHRDPAPVRPQRRARLLRRRRAAVHPHRRDARRRGRARAEARRRVLRRGQDARHRRPEPRGAGRAEVVQGRRSRSRCWSRCCSPPRSPAGWSSG